MERFPRDRFDELPRDIERVGAHRAPGRRGAGWIAFGWAVVAVVVLTAGGLFGLSFLNPDLSIFPAATQTETPEPEPEQTAEPVTDPSTIEPELLAQLTIAVLNGTGVQGMGATAADQIAAAGWPQPATAAAESSAEVATMVYYPDPADEGYARGIAKLIGAVDVELSDAFIIADITVVLGSDYTAPAAD